MAEEKQAAVEEAKKQIESDKKATAVNANLKANINNK